MIGRFCRASRPGPTADLDPALSFVIERISQEAIRSGTPLDTDESDFLRRLPRRPTNPTLHMVPLEARDAWLALPIRDLQFERLCKLAKDAHRHDVEVDPEAAHHWDFATAVLMFNHHPMFWLLSWAHLKIKKARGLSDGCLLLTTALLVVVVSILGLVFVSSLVQRYGDATKKAVWIASGCVFIGFTALLYFAARRLELWQDRQTVEKYRCDLPTLERQDADN